LSEQIQQFEDGARSIAVALPFDLEEAVGHWGALRAQMIRRMPEGFTRDEWAYVISFAAPENLMGFVVAALGAHPASRAARPPALLLRPRGAIAVWLPGNVSLLGPLTVVLLSLTGNRLHLKADSGGGDLTSVFLAYARDHLPSGPLRSHLEEHVAIGAFDRDDPRNREMASAAAMRIVFGSDAAAAAIHALPHPVDSIGLSFSDRRSEAWLDAEAADAATIESLIKVFAIYGQAGCTSPRRVVVLDAPANAAWELRDRLAAAWPTTVRDVPMHLASANIMARQWSRAAGWDSVSPQRNGAVLACGDAGLEAVDSPLFLPIAALPLPEAVATLPRNVQTIGVALAGRGERFPLELAARTSVKRVVPIARMHHFGPIWDGRAFWREAFEEVPVEP
jgi:hypothetical protein